MANSCANPTQVEKVQREFLRNAGLLRGFILALLPDHNLAEDVFQDVFLMVTRKADDYCPGTNFLAWARSIARLLILEYCRKQKASIQVLDPEVLEVVMAAAPVLDETWSRRRKELAGCLDRLAPRAREILELRYGEDVLLPPQIASRVSWSVSAVHVALTRARKFLHDCVQRRLLVKENVT